MDLETAQSITTAKFPILKQGEYDMWRLRIEQYFQVQDYALLDVIENGNSFKPTAQTTKNADGTSTSLIPGPYKDAKTLFAAIETRFGGNEATKKTQKTLLKLSEDCIVNYDEVPTNMALMAFSDSENLARLPKAVNTARPNSAVVNAVRANQGHPQKEDQGYVDSGCSRHMTGNMSYLSDFKEFDGGYVTFGGGAKGGKITGKRTLKTGKLDFEDVYFVKELQFNLFSVSQMCDKKNSVLFTDTGCFVLSPDFKLADESQVLLKVPRKNNMYSVDMKNIVPKECLTCLVAKATLDESML
ncbi:hypothetical protein Tco_0211133 [Tanacetum coccineum]